MVWVLADGREWRTRLEIPASIALRDHGYDLRDHRTMAEVLGDPWRFADFAWAYFRANGAAEGVGEVQFLELLTATESSVAECRAAITAGIIDFFRRRGDAPGAAVYVRAAAAVQRIANAIAGSVATNPEFDGAVDRAIAAVDAELTRSLAEARPNFGKGSTS